MSRRRLVPLLVLIALALAPFGRMGIAEAKATLHPAAAMAAHCAGQTPADDDDSRPVSIDCMIACAAVTPPASPALAQPLLHGLDAAAAVLPDPLGVLPEAEPPPPRLA